MKEKSEVELRGKVRALNDLDADQSRRSRLAAAKAELKLLRFVELSE